MLKTPPKPHKEKRPHDPDKEPEGRQPKAD